VLHKGDVTSGTIVLTVRVRGQNPRLFDRFPSLNGRSSWKEIKSEATDSEQNLSSYYTRRAERDPDLWLIELDIAEPERLTLYLGCAD
jgi:hypothetical protein